jgi:hypothetical protein
LGAAQYRALVERGALVKLDGGARGAQSAVTNANENVGRKILEQFDRQRHRAHVLDLFCGRK